MAWLPVLAAIVVCVAACYAFSRQLARPSGWFGRTVMPRLLNHGNRQLLDAAVAALAPGAGERVLDVGFGGAYTLRILVPLVAPERPVGVELARELVEIARSQLGTTVELHVADVASLPFPAASLDGALTVNTIYFWPDPSAGLHELRRVLKPGGRLVLGARSVPVLLLSPFAWFGFRLYSRARLAALLADAGFDVSAGRAGRMETVLVGRPRQGRGGAGGCATIESSPRARP